VFQVLVIIFGHDWVFASTHQLYNEIWLPPLRRPFTQVSGCKRLVQTPLGLVYQLTADPWGTSVFVRILRHQENAGGLVHQVTSPACPWEPFHDHTPFIQVRVFWRVVQVCPNVGRGAVYQMRVSPWSL